MRLRLLQGGQYVDVDGARLWTRSTGTGPGLLLCHGGPGMWCYMEALEELLTGVTLHRYDQRGCGRSTGSGPYTLERYVADLEGMRLHYGYESWAVGGHSWGATLALAYMWAHPERVKALVYMSGTGLGDGWRQPYRTERARRLSEQQNQRLAELDKLERSAQEETEFLALGTSRDFADRSTALERARVFHAEGWPINYEANRLLGAECGGWSEDDGVTRCRDVRAPVLVLHGELDPRPWYATSSLVRALPDVRRVVLTGAGHFPWVERPRELREALNSFLGQVLS